MRMIYNTMGIDGWPIREWQPDLAYQVKRGEKGIDLQGRVLQTFQEMS